MAGAALIFLASVKVFLTDDNADPSIVSLAVDYFNKLVTKRRIYTLAVSLPGATFEDVEPDSGDSCFSAASYLPVWRLMEQMVQDGRVERLATCELTLDNLSALKAQVKVHAAFSRGWLADRHSLRLVHR